MTPTKEEIEAVADAIDEARYRHPEMPRPRPRPFAEADKGDREYAMRLAKAALIAASQSRAPSGMQTKLEEAREYLRNLWRSGAIREREHYGLIAIIDAAEAARAPSEDRARVIEECARVADAKVSFWNEQAAEWATPKNNLEAEFVRRAAKHKAKVSEDIAAAIRALPHAEAWNTARIKDTIDSRLNDYLCEMKPGYDDSIVGFNEAWDIVRKVFADAELPSPPLPTQGENPADTGKHTSTDRQE